MAAGLFSDSGLLMPEEPRPEGGEFLALISDDRHAAGFQHFQRLWNIEDRLGAGADDDDAGARQFLEIG